VASLKQLRARRRVDPTTKSPGRARRVSRIADMHFYLRAYVLPVIGLDILSVYSRDERLPMPRMRNLRSGATA
jgi:hypothetical protein